MADVQGNATPIEGRTADGAVHAGRSVAVGGRADSGTPAAVDSGDLVALFCDVTGRLQINLNQVGGTATSVNSGTVDAGTQRVVLATNQPAVQVNLDGTQPNASHTRNAAFSESVAAGGELDDTTPVAATEGNVSPVRITAQRAFHVNLRDNSGSEIGTSGSPVRVDPTGTTTQPVSGTVSVNLNASTNTIEVVGDAAHDAAAAGNPLLVGAQMETMADSAPGTRASADGDANTLATLDGAIYVAGRAPQSWSYHLNTSTAQTDTTVHSTPGAGLSVYVTDIVFSHDGTAAINMFLEEGTTTTILGPYYLDAQAGGLAIHFETPKKLTANTALSLTTSASHAQAVDITGFIAP